MPPSKFRILEPAFPKVDEPPADGHDLATKGVLKLTTLYLFMRYFEYCATQQNFSRMSDQRCVFNYSLRHPKFYQWCRKGDFILQAIFYIILVVVAGYSAYKILV